MLSASATVGFSFCDSLEKMGHIHLNKCIPKEEERLEKLRKEELIAAETSAVAATANYPTPVAPSVSNVFNFGTVPNGGVQIQPPQQSQLHQLPQSQQQQPSSPSNSICTNPTPSRHSRYGFTPSPPIAPPAQENSQPPHTLASTSLPSTPSSSVPAPTPPPVAAVVPAPTSSQRRSKKDKWSANYVKSRKIENSKYRKRRYLTLVTRHPTPVTRHPPLPTTTTLILNTTRTRTRNLNRTTKPTSSGADVSRNKSTATPLPPRSLPCALRPLPQRNPKRSQSSKPGVQRNLPRNDVAKSSTTSDISFYQEERPLPSPPLPRDQPLHLHRRRRRGGVSVVMMSLLMWRHSSHGIMLLL